ncbi:MAG: FtsB family cell division protein, partial [Actinomycetota bacterium]
MTRGSATAKRNRKKPSVSSRARARMADASKNLRRATPRESRLLQHPVARRILGLSVAGVLAAFVFTRFWMPTRDYFSQRTALAQKQAEYDALADANEQLQVEVNELQTPEGVRRAARDHLGFVMPGEKRLKLLPPADLPVDLPAQWPYTLVTGIVTVRHGIATAGNAPLAPLSP